ncbi:MAG TPA: peptidoglycan-associated lipoprotein Pal [Gallionella sp.]|nr:peptidoglycan-associated lipoprotein Pal [Gallionella sp.]
MKSKLVISLVLANLLAACASEKPKEVAPPPETKPAPAAKPAAPAAAAPKAIAPAAQVAVDPLNDPDNILYKRSVYYPFDVAAIQPAYVPLVQAHAKYLAEHPARKVRLEGNCDERGSNEYNLALGQRRADGVKRMLEAGGADPTQLESISYGEEKPKSFGHDEASWAQNRRTDIHYMN